MNRLALPPTDMFIGHHVSIGTSMAMGCRCRNDALAPLIPSFRAVWLTLTDSQPGRIGEGVTRLFVDRGWRITPSAPTRLRAVTVTPMFDPSYGLRSRLFESQRFEFSIR